MCVLSSCRGKPGIEASPQPGGSGHPSAASTPCCLPGCSHLCTTMSGIFLSAQLGGEVVCGAMRTACTWASARGKPAKQPPRPLACPPGREGWEGRAGPRLPKSLGGAGPGEPDRDTHPARPRHRQPRPRQAALPLTVGGRTGHSARVLWGQQRHWSVSHRTRMGTHGTPRHTGTCIYVTPVHTQDVAITSVRVGIQDPGVSVSGEKPG